MKPVSVMVSCLSVGVIRGSWGLGDGGVLGVLDVTLVVRCFSKSLANEIDKDRCTILRPCNTGGGNR